MPAVRVTSGHDLPGGLPFALGAGTDRAFFISGMPAIGPDGKYRPGTFAEEVRLAWQNITGIAAAGGYREEEIVYVQCVVADIGDYAALNDWWRSRFPDPQTAPARFTFQAGALPFGCKIEIQATAVRAG